MNIINHGKWTPYVPAKLPDDLPELTLFLRRDDGKDWYEYIKENFQPDTVKFQALFQDYRRAYVIGPAVTDVSKLFPRNQFVGEIVGYKGSDPQKDFGQKLYDPIKQSITEGEKNGSAL